MDYQKKKNFEVEKRQNKFLNDVSVIQKILNR